MSDFESYMTDRRNKKTNSTVTTPIVWFIRENGETLTVPKNMIYPILTMPQGDNGMMVTINGLGFMISLQGFNLMPLVEDLANGRISHINQTEYQGQNDPTAPIIQAMTWQAPASGI